MTNHTVAPRGVRAGDEVTTGAECPECGCELVFTQPDEDLADRLLASCGDCKTWFLAGPGVWPLVPLPGTGGGDAE